MAENEDTETPQDTRRAAGVRIRHQGHWKCIDIEDTGAEHQVLEDQLLKEGGDNREAGVDREVHPSDIDLSVLWDHEDSDDSAQSQSESDCSTIGDSEESRVIAAYFDPGSPYFDSNHNASPRSRSSRVTATEKPADMQQSSPSGGGPGCMDRTEKVAVVIVLCIVIFPYLVLWWSSPDGSWPALQMLWRLLFQSIAVAFSTGLVLLGLQVQFSSYQLRQLVARLFKLEMGRDEVERQSQGNQTDISTTTIEHKDMEGRSEPAASQTPGPGEAGEGDVIMASEPLPISAEPEKPIRRSVSEAATQTDVDKKLRVNLASCERRYRKAMKRLYRKFLQIRRKCQAEMLGLRKADREASEFLSRVQMSLPSLQKEKQALLAELEAIEVQHAEEKRRNQDLVTRLQRLNNQFLRIGQPRGSSSSQTFLSSSSQGSTLEPTHSLSSQAVTSSSTHSTMSRLRPQQQTQSSLASSCQIGDAPTPTSPRPTSSQLRYHQQQSPQQQQQQQQQQQKQQQEQQQQQQQEQQHQQQQSQKQRSNNSQLSLGQAAHRAQQVLHATSFATQGQGQMFLPNTRLSYQNFPCSQPHSQSQQSSSAGQQQQQHQQQHQQPTHKNRIV